MVSYKLTDARGLGSTRVFGLQMSFCHPGFVETGVENLLIYEEWRTLL